MRLHIPARTVFPCVLSCYP